MAKPPHTITSALKWLGQTQQDWSDDCRFFSQTHWSAQTLLDDGFRPGVRTPHGTLPPRIYTAQDDSLIRKTGRHIPGVAYARAPLGSPLSNQPGLRPTLGANLAVAPTPRRGASLAGLAPVTFPHAPTSKVPRRASPEQQAAVKEVQDPEGRRLKAEG